MGTYIFPKVSVGRPTDTYIFLQVPVGCLTGTHIFPKYLKENNRALPGKPSPLGAGQGRPRA